MNTDHGEKLLSAVEHLLADNHTILAEVEGFRADTCCDRDAMSRRLVRAYSNRSALAGAAAAAPAIFPGVGTWTSLGAVLVEMTYVLKTETEMCLALCAAYNFDIRLREHRQIAMLLAAVGTHEVSVGRNPLLDFGEITMEAVLTYTPRELSKVLLKVFSAIAVHHVTQGTARRLVRLAPLIGVGIGAGVNKVMTARVGRAAHRALAARTAAAMEGRAAAPSA